jgi:hypothetical protein
MKACEIWPHLRKRATARIQRAYRHSELRKLLLWLKGKTLHWAIYVAAASLLIGGFLGLHNYLRSFLYVVWVGEREVGAVRDAAEIENFVSRLTEQCSVLYGMNVQPGEAVALNWEHRPHQETDLAVVKDALRQHITLVTDAVMVKVDDAPVLVVASPEDVNSIVEMLCNTYIRPGRKCEAAAGFSG